MWTNYNLEYNKLYQWRIGEIILFAERREKDIYMSITRQVGASLFDYMVLKSPNTDNVLNWQSFLTDNTGTIRIKPVMPNRSVLFKPDNEITILPGKKGWFYLIIPLWIEIYAGTESMPERLMIEEPTIRLSNTWIGDSDNGVLSYSLDAPAYLYPEHVSPKGFQAICPIQIYNESATVLKIDRLHVETEYLKIFSNKTDLFSNEIKMKYEGESNPSQTQIGKKQPAFAKDAELISEERIVPTGNLLRRSFFFLKSNAGF